jgi:hypothetical protein
VTETVKLVGPGLLALVVLGVLIWAVSAYVGLDSLRRRVTDFAGVPEGRWFYVVPQIVFFFAFFAWQVPFVQSNVPWIGNLLLATPFVLAQQMAYMLRVVFPTRGRLELRLEAERAAGLRGDEEPDDGAPAPGDGEAGDGFHHPSGGDTLKPADDDSFFLDDSDDRSSQHA